MVALNHQVPGQATQEHLLLIGVNLLKLVSAIAHRLLNDLNGLLKMRYGHPCLVTQSVDLRLHLCMSLNGLGLARRGEYVTNGRVLKLLL